MVPDFLCGVVTGGTKNIVPLSQATEGTMYIRTKGMTLMLVIIAQKTWQRKKVNRIVAILGNIPIGAPVETRCFLPILFDELAPQARQNFLFPPGNLDLRHAERLGGLRLCFALKIPVHNDTPVPRFQLPDHLF